VDAKQPADARFTSPRVLCVDRHNNDVYIQDGTGVLRKIDSHGEVQTIHLKVDSALAADSKSGSVSEGKIFVGNAACDSTGNLYVTSRSSHTGLFMIAPDGSCKTFSSTSCLPPEHTWPESVAVDPDDGYVVIAEHANRSLLCVSPDGKRAATLAGASGKETSNPPCDGSRVRFERPSQLLIDRTGAVWLLDLHDTQGARIFFMQIDRKVKSQLLQDSDGVKRVVKRSGESSSTSNGSANTKASDARNGTHGETNGATSDSSLTNSERPNSKLPREDCIRTCRTTCIIA